jgi:hypothetical protein
MEKIEQRAPNHLANGESCSKQRVSFRESYKLVIPLVNITCVFMPLFGVLISSAVMDPRGLVKPRDRRCLIPPFEGCSYSPRECEGTPFHHRLAQLAALGFGECFPVVAP